MESIGTNIWLIIYLAAVALLWEKIPGEHVFEKIMGVITAAFLFIAFIITPTPQESAMFIASQGWSTKPFVELPSLLWLGMGLLDLVLVSDALYSSAKNSSDTLFVEGWDDTDSCIAGNLVSVGDFAFILSGGVKFLGDIFKGDVAVIVPRTHLFQIGTSVIVDALCGLPGDLKYTPWDMKDLVRARRGSIPVYHSGTVQSCCVGFLSNYELKTHIFFEPKNVLKESYDVKYVRESVSAKWATWSFITEVMKQNGFLNIIWEIESGEITTVKNNLGAFVELTKKANIGGQEPSGLSKFLYSGS